MRFLLVKKCRFSVALFLAVLFSVVPVAYAATASDWIVVEKDANQTVLIDRANVNDVGEGIRQAWVQFAYRKKTPEGATTSIGLFHFNRNPDRLRNIQDTLFDASGNVIYVRRPEKVEDWSPIPSDSTGQIVIEYVYSVPPTITADGK